MKWIVEALIAFVLSGGAIILAPGAATAQRMAEHVVGDQCIGADIGRKDVAPNGQAIICDSSYHWEPYVGQTPNDPWVAGQN